MRVLGCFGPHWAEEQDKQVGLQHTVQVCNVAFEPATPRRTRRDARSEAGVSQGFP